MANGSENTHCTGTFFLFLLYFREYTKGNAVASPRGAWLRLVKDAKDVSELKEAVLMLEENFRGLQEAEDVMDGGRLGE